MAITITENDVARIARLARIALTQDEQKKMTHELGAILTYVEQLQAVATDGVEPTTHVGVDMTPLREDVAEPFDRAGDLIAVAPATEERYVKTKAVFS